MSFYLLISLISFLNNYTSNLKKENEITISRIEFLSAINDQEFVSRTNFSTNLASSVNSSAINNNLNIDRSLPLSNDEISIWINESNFIDLFNWLIEINNNNVEITKMNIRRVSKDSVSAQLTFKS
jgi:type II secretory pathway component PulM